MRGTKKSKCSQNCPVNGQLWSFTGCNLSRHLTSPIVEAAIEAHLENLRQHWYCVLFFSQFIFHRWSLYICVHLRSAMVVFFRVSFHKDLLQLINGFFLTDSNVRRVCGMLCPTNTLSCEGHIIPTFWNSLNILFKSGRNALFEFDSTCSKEITHKQIDDPFHRLSCAIECRFAVSWLLVSKVSKLVYATVKNTIRNKIYLLVWCHTINACVVLCQEFSNIVEVHHSHNLQVLIHLQQYVVDDVLPVTFDTNFCWLPSHNSFEIQVSWKSENLFAGNLSVCLGILSICISLSSWKSCFVCLSSTQRPVTQLFGLNFQSTRSETSLLTRISARCRSL